MNDFTSYFIAVPLPDKWIDQYKIFMDELKRLDSGILVSNPSTLHITLFYLTKLASDQLSDIEKICSKIINSVSKFSISVENVVTFLRYPKILYLNVKPKKILADIHRLFMKELNLYAADDNNFEFIPHVTIATLPNHNDEIIQKITNTALDIKWEFELTQLAIYGADSKQNPEFQKKILSIIKN